MHSPINASHVESVIAEELDLLVVILSLMVGHNAWMNLQKGIQGSGTTLLGTNNKQRRKT